MNHERKKAHGKQVSVGKSGRQWVDGYLRLPKGSDRRVQGRNIREQGASAAGE
ncbi:hypothetical protein AT6N2_C1461 [Agrobacterium tumefaciens]|nr:hypothetical protein AT6N2_C1461 [Agrobacterium tumefaciens]